MSSFLGYYNNYNKTMHRTRAQNPYKIYIEKSLLPKRIY